MYGYWAPSNYECTLITGQRAKARELRRSGTNRQNNHSSGVSKPLITYCTTLTYCGPVLANIAITSIIDAKYLYYSSEVMPAELLSSNLDVTGHFCGVPRIAFRTATDIINP